MKIAKLFFLTALALMTAACSNDDNDLTTQQPQKTEGITITAQLAPKDAAATSRAVADNSDNKITATWAANEHVAILYEVNSTKYTADATITSVDGDGTATISFTVEAGTPDDTPCTLVYPLAAAKADHSGVKDYADLLATQDGVLDNNLDVRMGEGTIQTTTPGLTVTTQPAAQYSIFKFTTQNIGGTNKEATQFKVSDNSGNVITTVTPASATGTLYVALPALTTGTYWFNATIDSKSYIAKADITTATVAGKYYQTTVKMATVGDAILSNSKFAAKGTSDQQAIIVYVGTVDKYFNHFLALALEDAVTGNSTDGGVSWNDALTAVGTYAAAHPITIGSTTYNDANAWTSAYDVVTPSDATTSATATTLHQGWRMPTITDWRYLYAGIFGKSATDPLGINNYSDYGYNQSSGADLSAIRKLVSYDILDAYNPYNTYWFSSEVDGESDKAWRIEVFYVTWGGGDKTNVYHSVVAVFAY